MNTNLVSIARDNTMRVSPFKLNNLVKSIVNQKVNKAINQLKFSQKRISSSVLKVLNAAIANAENNNQLDIDYLFVKEAYVGKGLSMKRFRPRAKGRASKIIKPFSKLTIILEERGKLAEKNKDKKGKGNK
jgi:large subunit ribosomal protein L22